MFDLAVANWAEDVFEIIKAVLGLMFENPVVMIILVGVVVTSVLSRKFR